MESRKGKLTFNGAGNESNGGHWIAALKMIF
jgi:hypothetical protein